MNTSNRVNINWINSILGTGIFAIPRIWWGTNCAIAITIDAEKSRSGISWCTGWCNRWFYALATRGFSRAGTTDGPTWSGHDNGTRKTPSPSTPLVGDEPTMIYGCKYLASAEDNRATDEYSKLGAFSFSLKVLPSLVRVSHLRESTTTMA